MSDRYQSHLSTLYRRSRRFASLKLATLIVTTTALALASTPAVAVARVSETSTMTVPLSAQLASDLERLSPTRPYGVFVHFNSGTRSERDMLLTGHGLTVAGRFDEVDVVYAVGTVADVAGLTTESTIGYLEANKALRYSGDTGPWASGVRIAQQPVAGGPYLDAEGNVLDGRGVGVAVIDSGIDGLHPDLSARMGRNFKVVCSTGPLISTVTYECFGPVVFQEAAVTDNTGGHGTHVAGIVAGDGTASRGTFTGVAPGATLYGFGTGEALSIFSEVSSLQYILRHFDEFNPRIRVINNSYGDGGGSRFDPNGVLSKVVGRLIDRGVSVVYAAGNDGGNGSFDATSSFSKNPTPGVISVANYDDKGTGTRQGNLNASSSRGFAKDPSTYPDISAPGTFITSTCRAWLPVCQFGPEPAWAPDYSTITGTSMASPHVAAAAALIYQARPELAPAQVEDVLQDHALKFTAGSPYVPDPQNAGSTTSVDKGAGLVDMPAVLDALGISHVGASPRASKPEVSITTPAPGDVIDGGGMLQASGTGFDGVPQLEDPLPQAVITDAPGDGRGPDAADVRGMTMSETAETLRVRIDVEDLHDLGINDRVVYSVRALIAGRSVSTDIAVTADGASSLASSKAGYVDAQEVSLDLESSSIVFAWPFAALGDPPSGAPVHGTSVTSYSPLVSDTAPGGDGADRLARPEYGHAFSLVRAGTIKSSEAQVTLSIDGGRGTLAGLTGTSPSYDWSSQIDTGALSDGDHTLRATLSLGGRAVASHSVTFSVRRPTYTHHLSITSPADGATVSRTVMPIIGEAGSDAPGTAERLVTVQVTGTGYDSGEGSATGTDPWSHDVDFGLLAAGRYDVTARLYVGGSEVARYPISVTVPDPSFETVACAPEAQPFWKAQFDGSHKAVLTPAEVEALGDRGAALSDQYFSSRSALVGALSASGKLTALAQAERQYAALLLNLAGGDLSATMSYRVGLSGTERLDPVTYEIGVVGETVDSAAAWIRQQLPSGDLARAKDTAASLNKGGGLTC